MTLDIVVLHTAAYWLMLIVRDARLLKIVARITETASRVRIALAAACPEAGLFRSVARSLQPAGCDRRGAYFRTARPQQTCNV